MKRILKRSIVILSVLALVIAGTPFSGAVFADDEAGAKVIRSVRYDPVTLSSDGGTVTATVQGDNLFENGWFKPEVYCGDKYIENAVDLNRITDDFSGTYTIKLPVNPGTEDKVYTVRYMSARYDYQNPALIVPESGAETVLTVAGRETALDPSISSIEYSKTKFRSSGGEVLVNVKGNALTQLTRDDLTLECSGKAITDDIIPLSLEITDDNNALIRFTLPANSDEKDLAYTLRFGRGAEGVPGADQEIVVSAANEAALVESIKYDDGFTEFYATGEPNTGFIYLRMFLTGENLDKLSKSDFLFEVDGKQVDLDDTAAFSYDRQFDIAEASDESAEVHIVFPKNNIEDERQCSITVLCAADGVENKTKIVPMKAKKQDPDKIFRLEVDDWQAVKVDEGCIKVIIKSPEGVSLNVTPEEAKEYIYFATGVDSNENIRNLTEEDAISMEDNILTIELADKTTAIPPFVVFRSGVLRNSEGKYLGHRTVDGGNHYIYYHAGAHIESVSYNQITFDSNGGHVVATIKGTNLGNSAPAPLWGKVLVNNETEPASTIEAETVSINEEGTEAVFEFDVPENKTDKTVSYRMLPVVNSFNAVPTYLKGYDVISVLPAGAGTDSVTLSCIDIQGESDEDLKPDVFVTEMKSEQFTAKCDLVIRGTNLSSKKAVVKAVDEEGIVWPLLPVHECGATFRWQNSSMYLPESESLNEQHIELLIPMRLGKTHTFTFTVAPDGEHFDENVTATATIRNEGLFDYEDMHNRDFVESDFTDIVTVTVKYVDESGKELAPADKYRGYGITELYYQGIAPKTIKGYELKGYSPENLDLMLKQPVQVEDGKFKFEDGQWFFKDLRDADGDMTPIVYTYTKDAETIKAEKEAAAKAAEAKAKKVKTVTVNTKTVNAAAIDKAVKKAGGSKKYVTKIVLGSKVKTIKASSFKKYTKVTTLEVKTKKLTKKSIKKALKGSKVKTVKVKIGSKKVNKKFVKKYKKIFTKKIAGKKAKVK